MEKNGTTNSQECLESESYFAPAGRDLSEKIKTTYELIVSDKQATALLDAIPLVAFILNEKRQIVFVNRQGLQVFNTSIDAMRGKRPGELIGCIHSQEGPDQCGTSVACKMCGAVNAILGSQQDETQRIEECRITTIHNDSFNWKVMVSPIDLCGCHLQCLMIEDISDQKRRQVLERMFFHDIINTIGAIRGFCQMLIDEPEPTGGLNEIIFLTGELVEEVQAQWELTLAESGELVPRFEDIELSMFLKNLVELYQLHPEAKGRNIVVLNSHDYLMIKTDSRLLRRILGNMIKNALEACDKSRTVTLFCEVCEEEIVLSVHNPYVMSEEVKLQLFKRSFSTKGIAGHGIGTYSMKLLGEKYLGGHVTFTSEPGQGTTFSISLPHN